MKLKASLIFILCFFTAATLWAQNPERFQNEVEQLTNKEFPMDEAKETVVFTGSSSIRMWTDVDMVYPEVNAINTGFGGSQFSDLIYYRQKLIFKHQPDKIFIYEGDNDISENKPPSEVLAGAAFLYGKIVERLPDAKIYFISPKPSIARWQLKDEYQQVNKMLADFCAFDEDVAFIDVWNPMLNDEGKPMPDIFIEDGLHMNEKGYQIWAEIFQPYVNAQ